MDNDTFERFSAMDFTETRNSALFDQYRLGTSGKTVDLDIQLVTSLKKSYPEMVLTTIPASNADLIRFATAGNATAEIDLKDETVIRWRGYIPPPQRGGGEGYLADAIFFAKYHYNWGNEDFILYTVVFGYTTMQYILKEPRGGEKVQDHSKLTDSLISAVGSWQSIEPDALYVFDGYWYKSPELWREVQKASWDKVILDEKMKKDLVSVSDTFFDSRDIYEEYGVPWKRGLIFHGPPGNGKTISIKALMHSMYQRKERVPCLYVKSAPYTYMIADIFELARSEAPCMLIFEDMDTIVTPTTRAYFFNEVDGVANNDGIMMVASTNYLDRLDPGLTKRPSRFDRKYFFPMPSKDERELYCQYWRNKVKGKPIDFPSKLCPAIADITDGFSFAYLQELFIATLLAIVRDEAEDEAAASSDDNPDDDLDDYVLWRVIKKQAKILRDDMDSGDEAQSRRGDSQGGKAGDASGEETREARVARIRARVAQLTGKPAAPAAASAEQVPLLHGAEVLFAPGKEMPFPANGDRSAMQLDGSNRIRVEDSSRVMQPIAGQRLTSEQALRTLAKTSMLGPKVWEWVPPPRPDV